jgi:hypothetical protein
VGPTLIKDPGKVFPGLPSPDVLSLRAGNFKNEQHGVFNPMNRENRMTTKIKKLKALLG